ncbi:DUF4158 domain-containing protein [Rhodococcus qingshengii]|uniref:DUF4158 domain-containing protein n=1 Tax=Rhodococcus qingshengii TaxID=334542 RepID=UPI001BEB23B5|nr:DUF4158 domain-containing protein [Rhodococcus qingshengii]MBT2274330.1 DUF4158 domain-containing protein [Rhodococcus qingshengii]
MTVRQLGMFLADPLDGPPEWVVYLAEQLGIEGSSCVKHYTERDKTKLRSSIQAVAAQRVSVHAAAPARQRRAARTTLATDA